MKIKFVRPSLDRPRWHPSRSEALAAPIYPQLDCRREGLAGVIHALNALYALFSKYAQTGEHTLLRKAGSGEAAASPGTKGLDVDR